MKITITGARKEPDNHQTKDVHLATIHSHRVEVVGRVVLECLAITQKEPNLCDSIEVQESDRSN